MRYFVNGKEITAEEAEQIKRNNIYLLEESEKTGNIELILDCKFITILED